MCITVAVLRRCWAQCCGSALYAALYAVLWQYSVGVAPGVLSALRRYCGSIVFSLVAVVCSVLWQCCERSVVGMVAVMLQYCGSVVVGADAALRQYRYSVVPVLFQHCGIIATVLHPYR